jgi:hypothetical protein
MATAVFPDDISLALTRSVQNPAASCSDHDLMRALRKYDQGDQLLIMIEELDEGALFQLKDGRIFKRGEKLRKRFKGVEVKTGQTYLFSALYEVRSLISN